MSTTRMPVLFVGHGSPMNAIEDTRWSRGFAALGRDVPKPRAILAVSAHWFVPGTFLTAEAEPRTIHDFGGFPRELFEVQYPAPGAPDLAKQVQGLLGGATGLKTDWGLDHGTWSVLRWMFPDADVPVIQLSIDHRLTPQQHVDLARPLAGLREEGVLLVASGNLVHNLRDAFERMRTGNRDTPEWAAKFDRWAAEAVTQRDTAALLKGAPPDVDAREAHPSPDHWLPLLYAYGASSDADGVTFPNEGFDWGSISMRNLRFG